MRLFGDVGPVVACLTINPSDQGEHLHPPAAAHLTVHEALPSEDGVLALPLSRQHSIALRNQVVCTLEQQSLMCHVGIVADNRTRVQFNDALAVVPRLRGLDEA